jgi:predicted HTH transcriptional regulator
MRGSIFDIIDSTVAILQDECTIGRMEGARVINELDTPLAVLRELTTNAVVHRDLSLFGSQVRIQIFPRYIEWISPGGLPANITIATLLTAQFSRNPSLAQFLFHRTYIEKFGMDLDLVIETMRREHLSTPEFHDDQHSFRVRVRRKLLLSSYVPDLSTREGRVEAILCSSRSVALAPARAARTPSDPTQHPPARPRRAGSAAAGGPPPAHR